MPHASGSRFGYVRVATPAHDPQPQVAALTAFGIDPRLIFLDCSIASPSIRPGLARLLDQIEPGNALVIWRLDRLSRSITHLIRTVANLGAAGIGFISLTEAINTTPPAGRPQLQIFTALDTLHRTLIRERTADGLAAARAEGRTGGRPPAMTAEKIEAVHQLLAQGTPKTIIAQMIKVSRPTLYRHLQSPGNTTPNPPRRAN
ncbi:MAG: recombinase family protein [Actinomycetota bacterium]|nr:recombinase family protein [Actinomycetota bacterium]